MLTKDQIEERFSYITGSDCATILGVNPHESVFDLYMYKTRQKIKPDISHLPSVKMGHMLEPVVAQLFEEATGKKTVIPNGLAVHKEHSWMAGNVDRYIESENAILEIKTAGRDIGWAEQGVNLIPKHYLCQVSHYMAVCNVEKCYVAVLIAGTDFRHYTIERNKNLEDLIIAREKDFWYNNVLAEHMPEPRNYNEVISKFGNATLEKAVTATEDIERTLEMYRLCKANISENEEKLEKLKDKIGIFLGANEAILDRNGNVALTWKPSKESSAFDSKGFQEKHPDLYKQFIIKRPGQRRFILKGEKQ